MKSLRNVVKSEGNVKLIITKECNDQINLINKHVPKLEWSGILFYSVEGTILDPANMTLTCHNVFPVDIGTKGHTGWKSSDPDLAKFMDDNFDDMVEKGWLNRGLIHSHNDMGK